MDELQELLKEVVSLNHRLRIAAQELHGGDELTAGRRGVMYSLSEHGPQSISHLARTRPVSRQHMRNVVNPMVDDGLVELIANANHKRSPLVTLTRKGEELLLQYKRREKSVFGALRKRLKLDEVVAATAVLRQLRTELGRIA